MRRPMPKIAPLKIAPPGRFRRTPPAIFPPVLGLLGLALAWRGSGLSAEVAGFLGGVAVALLAFGALGYGAKIARRAGVVAEDLAILPGRAGLGAAVVSVPLAVVVLAPTAPGAALALFWGGMALHLAFWAVLVPVLAAAPPEQARVTPVWHLNFVGVILHARVALALAMPDLAAALTVGALAAAVVIYAASARQALVLRVPAPLRPLLAIHLAPLALAGTMASGLGLPGVAQALAWLAATVVVLGLVRLRWLTEAGVSPLWGAFTFPLAATAVLWQAVAPGSVPALALLALATIVVPAIAALVWREWATGRLPVRTNAAIA